MTEMLHSDDYSISKIKLPLNDLPQALGVYASYLVQNGGGNGY